MYPQPYCCVEVFTLQWWRQRGCWEVMRSEDRALSSGIWGPLMKRDRRYDLSLCCVKTQKEGAAYQPGREPFPEPSTCPDTALPAFTTVRSTCRASRWVCYELWQLG